MVCWTDVWPMTIASPCPSDERWEHYVHHSVTSDEAERLEQHLATCSNCLKKLKELSDRDELVQAFRQRSQAAESFADGSDVSSLLERLKALLPADPDVPHGRRYRLNCPHCQNPIAIVDDGRSEDVICPSC